LRAHVAATHVVGPNQFRRTVRSAEVNLGLAVTEDMDVRVPMVVGEDDDAEAVPSSIGDRGRDTR